MTPRTVISFAFCLISTLSSPELSAQTQASRLSQFGITWKFDKNYPVGQFANGDWWVVGPVKITSISPFSPSSGRGMHGSMINPSPRNGSRHGYDSTMKYNSYVASLNVARGVSSSNPLTVPVNSSLVSTISQSAASTRPQIKGASILTVLSTAAPKGAFRPPYCGTDKRIKFNESQLNLSLIKRLKMASGAPSLASVERGFERPWLDHIPNFPGREHHPKDNMRDYGRDLSSQVGIGALMIHGDYPVTAKRNLIVRFVQLGIDLNGVADDGGNRVWEGNGGHASGRKWPILFAGLMLNDTYLKGIGSRKIAFGEDQQTFVVRETSPGKFNWGYGGYTSAHKGMPEWGMRHATRPQEDTVNWGVSYRLCCTANSWPGFITAAHIMGATKLWNHDALFDYHDRFVATIRKNGQPGWMLAWDTWSIKMWDLYRKNGGGGGQPKPKLTITGKTRLASAYVQPAGLHKPSAAPTEVRLTWKTDPVNGLHSFRIYRAVFSTNPSFKQVGTAPLSDAYFVDGTVKKGAYLYEIAGVDQSGKRLIESRLRVDA